MNFNDVMKKQNYLFSYDIPVTLDLFGIVYNKYSLRPKIFDINVDGILTKLSELILKTRLDTSKSNINILRQKKYYIYYRTGLHLSRFISFGLLLEVTTYERKINIKRFVHVCE